MGFIVMGVNRVNLVCACYMLLFCCDFDFRLGGWCGLFCVMLVGL